MCVCLCLRVCAHTHTQYGAAMLGALYCCLSFCYWSSSLSFYSSCSFPFPAAAAYFLPLCLLLLLLLHVRSNRLRSAPIWEPYTHRVGVCVCVRACLESRNKAANSCTHHVTWSAWKFPRPLNCIQLGIKRPRKHGGSPSSVIAPSWAHCSHSFAPPP